MIAGADEAGKGPLIGNMYIVMVYLDEDLLNELCKKHIIKDSKKLSNAYIEKLYNILKDKIPHKVREILPREIDASSNLNELMIEKYIELVTSIDKMPIYIDCFLKTEEKLLEQFSSEQRPYIKTCHKADAIYPVVSLAGIFAKALREKNIKDIKQLTNVDIGSGYPSDPKTKLAYKTFYPILREYIRHKWQINFT
jgi:ribonuclease HII